MLDTDARACPFCMRMTDGDVLWSSGEAVAFLDRYPISPGHALVVPKRHEADLFALTPEERADVWGLVTIVKEALDAEHRPDGFNVGVNVAAAAGQTVGHAHVHVIPRHSGDVADPRGGVRWVIPDKAAYWER